MRRYVFSVGKLASKKPISVINDFLADFELHWIAQIHTACLLSLLRLQHDGSLLRCSAQRLRISWTEVVFDRWVTLEKLCTLRQSGIVANRGQLRLRCHELRMVLLLVQRVHVWRTLAVIVVPGPGLLRDSRTGLTLLNPVWSGHHPAIVMQLLVSELRHASIDSNQMVRRRPSSGHAAFFSVVWHTVDSAGHRHVRLLHKRVLSRYGPAK